MTYQCFSFNISNKVAHLQLNRPASMNTMQPVFWRELTEILQTLQREASARVLVISSTGKAICPFSTQKPDAPRE